MTPSGSSPTPRSYGSASWPIGFRGIGGHLLRSAPPVAPLPPPPPAPPPVPAAHGSFLLAPIVTNADGTAGASCPVCVAGARVPGGATWHELRCGSCGTEYVATDGSPPPAPSAPLGGPACPVCGTRPPAGGWTGPHCTACGIAFEGAPAPPVAPRAAAAPGPYDTPETAIHGTGATAVAPCPRCGTTAAVPRGAKGWVWFACRACGSRFKADSGAPPRPLADVPAPAVPEPSDAAVDGRLWDSCPRCGYGAMTSSYMGEELVQSCAVCGKRVRVGRVPRPVPPAAPPPPPPPWRGRRDTGPGDTPASVIHATESGPVCPCPKCGTWAAVPPRAAGWVWFACAYCRELFKADTSVRLGWPPPAVRRSLWARIRKWFTGG